MRKHRTHVNEALLWQRVKSALGVAFRNVGARELNVCIVTSAVGQSLPPSSDCVLMFSDYCQMGESYHHCTARFAGSGKASITTDTHLRFFWSKVTHVLEFKHRIPCSCGSHDTNVKPTRLCPPWYGLSCWHGVNHKALSQPIAGLHRDLQLVSEACLVGYKLIIHVCGYPLLNKSAEPLTHARVRADSVK